MTVAEFFEAYPWIKVKPFAIAIEVPPGLLQRCKDGYVTTPEWVAEKITIYLNKISNNFHLQFIQP